MLRSFQRLVVVSGEGVDCVDTPPQTQATIREMRADEPGGSSDDNGLR